MLEQFKSDIAALRDEDVSAPRQPAVLLAWRRSDATSLIGAFDGRMSNFTYYAGLYGSPAVKGAKPFIVFTVRGEDVEEIVDVPTDVEVRGWPAYGRAALMIAKDRTIWPTGPGNSVLRPKRLP